MLDKICETRFSFWRNFALFWLGYVAIMGVCVSLSLLGIW